MVIEPEQISEIKEYYNNLKLSAGYKNLIEIFMDTLVTGKDSLGVFATVVNNTNYPVYIASPKDAFPLFFEIKQSDGENISGFGDIVIERDALAKEITILLPKGKIKYTLWRSPIPYEIKLSSDSIFTIRIIYENELEYIRIPYDDKLSMEDCLTHVSDYESILQWKLPGEYFSKNSMIFKHTPDKK
jgi:hypothetical protein